MADTDTPVSAFNVPAPDGPPTPDGGALASASGMGGEGAGLSTSSDKPATSNATSNRWVPPGAKVMIGSLDDPKLTVEAQYNPKELQIDRAILWQQQTSPEVNRLVLEFSGEDPRTLSLEFLFDGYEEGEPVLDAIAKLESMSRMSVDKTTLDIPNDKRMSDVTVKYKAPGVRDESESHELKSGSYMDEPKMQGPRQPRLEDVYTKRPHFCFIRWGEWMGEDILKCVIENISAKYLMFSETGLPLRALVSLRLKEAHGVTIGRPEDILSAAEAQRKAKLLEGRGSIDVDKDKTTSDKGTPDKAADKAAPAKGAGDLSKGLH